ncbi:nucleobase:cation symporter-2 family protein [Heyndrickxia ginsengihumi]|uniref:nucleobase:cation symporter-2 family protein n=1 Tax=Heyndrickxia ginsengihumi TaxID=363870 RepID=UPI003D255CFB
MKGAKFKTLTLGIQHALAMYTGAVLVPLIVGGALKLSSEQLTYLVGIDLFMCGIATLLQIWKNRYFGIGLPVVLGCTFTAVTPMITIGSNFGLGAIYGAILVAGVFVILVSKFFSKLIRFFPPVVTGSVVCIIGLSLIPEALKNMAGGEGAEDYASISNLALSFGVLLLILILYRVSKGFIRSISVLLGLIVGTVVSIMMGKVDLTPVKEASWTHLPHLFYFGRPEFHITPIITMCIVCLVCLTEATGVYLAVGDICKQKVTQKDLERGYRAEGIAIIIGGLMNAFPYTTFSQNVGLVQLSGNKSVRAVGVTGTLLVILGLAPKIAAIATIIPTPVLGGAMVALFGTVIAYGIKMLSNVDLQSTENLLIIACSIGLGLGVTVVPDVFEKLPSTLKVIAGDGIVVGSLVAIALNGFYHVRTHKEVEAVVGERSIS